MKKIIGLFVVMLIILFSCEKQEDLTINQEINFNEIPLNDPLKTDDSLASKFLPFSRSAVDISKKIARVNYVVDYDLYTQLGSNEASCSTYVTKNHNLAMKAYEPFNIFTKIVRIEILKVPSVYTPLTNIYSILNAFNNNYYLLPGVDCNILLFAKPLGGVAFIGGVNSTSGRSLVCGVYPQDTYFNHFIIAHELGHYYGSNHTHDCWKWPNGTIRRIDSCFAGCSQTNTKFTTGGTIMSYCYNRGTIKLPIEFHFLCRDTMIKTLAKNTSIPVDGAIVPCKTTYSNWSSCINNSQTRTFTQTGNNCIIPPTDSLNRNCTNSIGTSVSAQMCYKGTNGKWRVKFNVPINANTYPTYAINVCRYDISCTTLQACGSRGTYTITTTEKIVGVIDRELNPQPANPNTCYRTSISPSSGNIFWTPNFITN